MKKIYAIAAFFLIARVCNAQLFFQNAEGEELFIFPEFLPNSRLLGKVNTTAQTLEFRTFINFANPVGILPKKFISIAVKGKPSDGIATLFNNGNFNVSTSASLAYIIVKPFQPQSAGITKGDTYTDFFIANVIAEKNQYTLFNPDSTFATQISSKDFSAFGFDLNYNALINGAHLLSVTGGYRRGNNYNKLQAIEIQDTQTYVDEDGMTRTSTKTVNARQGIYDEYEVFPVRVAYTYCPSESDSDKMKPGFTAFLTRDFGEPSSYTKIGGIVFLTKVEESTGVRLPIIGVVVQATDFFDEANRNNELTKRVAVGLTTTFNIAQE